MPVPVPVPVPVLVLEPVRAPRVGQMGLALPLLAVTLVPTTPRGLTVAGPLLPVVAGAAWRLPRS